MESHTPTDSGHTSSSSMRKTPQVKICGVSSPDVLEACAESGVRYVGFVFYPPSPRHLSFDTAWTLARHVPTGMRSIGLFVDPDDALLERILTGVPMDMIQLHGNETPERIEQIKAKYTMPIIKAIRVNDKSDLDGIEEYEAVCDWLLLDSKPKDAKLPGGTGHAFNWDLLKNRTFSKPWMLSGGLNTGNILDALNAASPHAIDLSSGVETAPGQKDITEIQKLMKIIKESNNNE
jgi:phosphoribosylanthranilate isomerase